MYRICCEINDASMDCDLVGNLLLGLGLLVMILNQFHIDCLSYYFIGILNLIML